MNIDGRYHLETYQSWHKNLTKHTSHKRMLINRYEKNKFDRVCVAMLIAAGPRTPRPLGHATRSRGSTLAGKTMTI